MRFPPTDCYLDQTARNNFVDVPAEIPLVQHAVFDVMWLAKTTAMDLCTWGWGAGKKGTRWGGWREGGGAADKGDFNEHDSADEGQQEVGVVEGERGGYAIY